MGRKVSGKSRGRAPEGERVSPKERAPRKRNAGGAPLCASAVSTPAPFGAPPPFGEARSCKALANLGAQTKSAAREQRSSSLRAQAKQSREAWDGCDALLDCFVAANDNLENTHEFATLCTRVPYIFRSFCASVVARCGPILTVDALADHGSFGAPLRNLRARAQAGVNSPIILCDRIRPWWPSLRTPSQACNGRGMPWAPLNRLHCRRATPRNSFRSASAQCRALLAHANRRTKDGKRTLVDVASLKAYYAGLPLKTSFVPLVFVHPLR